MPSCLKFPKGLQQTICTTDMTTVSLGDLTSLWGSMTCIPRKFVRLTIIIPLQLLLSDSAGNICTFTKQYTCQNMYWLKTRPCALDKHSKTSIKWFTKM